MLNFITIKDYAFDTSNSDYVKLYVTSLGNLKTLDKNNIKSKFSQNSFDVCIMNYQQKNYRFSCFNLSKDINPDSSYIKATSSGFIVYLAKANKSDFWDSLEKKKSILGDKDDDKNKNKDPNESLMDMMRDMYQNGDPEMVFFFILFLF